VNLFHEMLLNATITSLKKMFKRLFGLLALAIVLLTSCNTGGCYESTDVKVYCSFYQVDSLRAVGFDSVKVWGVGSDSLIYNNDSTNELALELNRKAQITQYVFQVKAQKTTYYFTDTITLYHTNQPWFQSIDCGCMVFSTLDSCKTTGSIFKSTKILDSKIINTKKEHVILNL